MAQVSTSLDTKELDRLDSLAAKLHVGRAAAMRMLVTGALKNIETAGLDSLIGEPDNWPVGPVYNIAHPEYDHPGVRFQVVCPAGVLIDANSDHLYFIAKYGGRATECYVSCPADCTEHGWYELFPGEGMAYKNSREVQLWIRPERLTDSKPDEGVIMTTGPRPNPEPATLTLIEGEAKVEGEAIFVDLTPRDYAPADSGQDSDDSPQDGQGDGAGEQIEPEPA